MSRLVVGYRWVAHRTGISEKRWKAKLMEQWEVSQALDEVFVLDQHEETAWVALRLRSQQEADHLVWQRVEWRVDCSEFGEQVLGSGSQLRLQSIGHPVYRQSQTC